MKKLLKFRKRKKVADISMEYFLMKADQVQRHNKVFTKWINLQLAKVRPPVEVTNLTNDLRDGQILLTLTEVLFGSKVTRSEPATKWVNQIKNVQEAMRVLRENNIKPSGVTASEITAGDERGTLSLIWKIIHWYQIMEVIKPDPKDYSVDKKLIAWSQDRVKRNYKNVRIDNLTSSWKDGLAFNILLNSFNPSLFDLDAINSKDVKSRLAHALNLAITVYGVPSLFEPEDFVDFGRDTADKNLITLFLSYLYQFTAKESIVTIVKKVAASPLETTETTKECEFRTITTRHETSHSGSIATDFRTITQAEEKSQEDAIRGLTIDKEFGKKTMLYTSGFPQGADVKVEQRRSFIASPFRKPTGGSSRTSSGASSPESKEIDTKELELDILKLTSPPDIFEKGSYNYTVTQTRRIATSSSEMSSSKTNKMLQSSVADANTVLSDSTDLGGKGDKTDDKFAGRIVKVTVVSSKKTEKDPEILSRNKEERVNINTAFYSSKDTTTIEKTRDEKEKENVREATSMLQSSEADANTVLSDSTDLGGKGDKTDGKFTERTVKDAVVFSTKTGKDPEILSKSKEGKVSINTAFYSSKETTTNERKKDEQEKENAREATNTLQSSADSKIITKASNSERNSFDASGKGDKIDTMFTERTIKETVPSSTKAGKDLDILLSDKGKRESIKTAVRVSKETMKTEEKVDEEEKEDVKETIATTEQEREVPKLTSSSGITGEGSYNYTLTRTMKIITSSSGERNHSTTTSKTSHSSAADSKTTMKVTNGSMADSAFCTGKGDEINAKFEERNVKDTVVSSRQKGENSDTLWKKKENKEKTQATVRTTKETITSDKEMEGKEVKEGRDVKAPTPEPTVELLTLTSPSQISGESCKYTVNITQTRRIITNSGAQVSSTTDDKTIQSSKADSNTVMKTTESKDHTFLGRKGDESDSKFTELTVKNSRRKVTENHETLPRGEENRENTKTSVHTTKETVTIDKERTPVKRTVNGTRDVLLISEERRSSGDRTSRQTEPVKPDSPHSFTEKDGSPASEVSSTQYYKYNIDNSTPPRPNDLVDYLKKKLDKVDQSLFDLECISKHSDNESMDLKSTKNASDQHKEVLRQLESVESSTYVVLEEGKRMIKDRCFDRAHSEYFHDRIDVTVIRMTSVKDEINREHQRLFDLYLILLKQHLERMNDWLVRAESRISLDDVIEPTYEEVQQQVWNHQAFQEELSNYSMANMILEMDLEHPALDETIKDWVKVLSERWAAVWNWAEEWKERLNQALVDWEKFREEEAVLLSWLSSKEQTFDVIEEVDITNEEQVTMHLNLLETMEKEMKSQEKRLDSLHETGEKLIEDAEYHNATAKGIRDQMDDFDRCWTDITDSVRERKEMLQDAQNKVKQMGILMKGVRAWLHEAEAFIKFVSLEEDLQKEAKIQEKIEIKCEERDRNQLKVDEVHKLEDILRSEIDKTSNYYLKRVTKPFYKRWNDASMALSRYRNEDYPFVKPGDCFLVKCLKKALLVN